MVDNLKELTLEKLVSSNNDFGGRIFRMDKKTMEYLVTQTEIKQYILSGELPQKLMNQLLNYFAEFDFIDYVRLLLDCGTDPNVCSDNAYALTKSSGSGNLDIAKLLIERGANVNPLCALLYDEEDIFTKPLPLAAISGHFEIVKLLVNNGADINAHDGVALRYGVRHNHYEIVKFLLERGAKINLDKYILMDSATYADIQIIKLLLDNGADIHADGGAALHESAERGRIEVVKLLLERGADIHSADDGILKWVIQMYLPDDIHMDIPYNYPIMSDRIASKEEILRFLLENGANVRANDNEVLKMCTQAKDFEIIKLLLQFY